jgi:hypothetical protein
MPFIMYAAFKFPEVAAAVGSTIGADGAAVRPSRYRRQAGSLRSKHAAAKIPGSSSRDGHRGPRSASRTAAADAVTLGLN